MLGGWIGDEKRRRGRGGRRRNITPFFVSPRNWIIYKPSPGGKTNGKRGNLDLALTYSLLITNHEMPTSNAH
jgi:hypothetical protein